MKNLHSFSFILLLVYLSINSIAQNDKPDQSVSLQKIWETPEILTTCESVCYNDATKTIFVSCIDGNPTDKDGNGFISQLSITGEIITLKWVTGINAPKGMGIYGNKLYVTDIDKVVEIDIVQAVIIKEYKVEGAKFLNDIIISASGDVYISDMATAKIHRIKKGIIETWFTSEEFVNPNGLFYEDKEILVGTKNGIYSIRIEDKRLWHVIKDTGGIDGLAADGQGSYIISDWQGKIQLVNTEKDAIILLNTSDKGINAADIEYIPERNMLLVPTFSDNRVMAYELLY
ncbi:MAG: hypothetical protein K8R74_15080 [Bacteroidales bacterium]|nr:hypothetical protein [Bacteroidales bacterium]